MSYLFYRHLEIIVYDNLCKSYYDNINFKWTNKRNVLKLQGFLAH